MRRHLLWIIPALLAGYIGWYLLATRVEVLPLLVRRHAIRFYDRDYERWLFMPAAAVEGLLRRPDDFTFRQRGPLGL
jgi:hypothetical protein